MNKKVALCLLVSSLAIGASVFLINDKTEINSNADYTPYSLDLTDISQGHYVDTYYGIDGDWRPFLFTNKRGGENYFKMSGYSFNAKYLYGGTDCYFTNLSPINGIESITITSDYDVLISYGYSPKRFDVENVALSSGATYNFDNNYPTYFRVSNSVADDNYIHSLSLSYSCEEHANPFNENYLVYEFNNATMEENKGYLVKNSSTKYDYLSGDIVIKDKYDDGEHGEYPVIGTYESIFHGTVTPFVRSVYFPDSITSYGDYLFNSNKSLRSVRLSPNAHTLSFRMFYECNNLQSINIPNGVHTIGAEAFVECNSIPTVVIPDSVTTINDGSFYGCFQGMDSLKSFTWSANMPKINAGCFKGTGLETVTIPDTVTEIGQSAFNSCSLLETVIIGKNVTVIGIHAFSTNNALTTVDFSRNTALTTISGHAFRDCNALTSITLPNTLTVIGGSAFRLCKNLKSVTFGNNVVTIGDYAFNGTALESVVIPGSATDLYFQAFESCTSLEEITISEGITKIPTACFDYCYALTTIHFPSTLTTIQGGAFEYCTSLETINLPASLTFLGKRAFGNCSKLATVNFGGTISEWNAVGKEDGNWYINTLVTVVHCSNGDVTI